MVEQDSSAPGWWGSFSLETGRTAHWRIGPLDLWIQRHPGEWRVAYEAGDDALDASLAHGVLEADDDLNGYAHVERFALSRTGDRVLLGPALADRAVISRPEKPFHLPAGEEATVFVSTPVWLCFRVGDGEGKLLRELAIARPSDTWFGPNTREGELCYTSRTYFVLNPDNLPRLPHRANTAVRILNRSGEELTVDRMRLPVPQLGLHATPDGRLWTQDVTYERTEGDEAELRVRSKRPRSVSDARPVAEPRDPVKGNLVVRAFSSLFDRGFEDDS